MLQIRRNADIHREQADWYDIRFHFSFHDYHDPAHNNFGLLHLFNDDTIAGGKSTEMHPHSDLEVVTYIVEGTFRHEDSLGNTFVLPAGSIECMTFGTGAEHVEHNNSATEPLRMILMYIEPDAKGLAPSVEHQTFPPADRTNRLRQIVGPMARRENGAVGIHQDASVYAATLTAGATVNFEVQARRGVYLYLIAGNIHVNDQALSTGDIAEGTEALSLHIEAIAASDLLLVDVPLYSM